MRGLRHLCVAFFLLLASGQGFKWSDKLGDGEDSMQVCPGHDIQLSWNYTLDMEERLNGVKWGWLPEGREEFNPMANFSGCLTHLSDAGVAMSGAAVSESGTFSLTVSVHTANGSEDQHTRSARLTVLDTPKSHSGSLEVSMKGEPVRDVTEGSWHVQLSCGNFSDLGQPPVEVVWTTPNEDQLTSSGFVGDVFQLLVPNPVLGGRYCCGLPPSLPAASCLPHDSPLLSTACVHLDETAARFSVLEASHQDYVERLAEERAKVLVLERRLQEQMGNMTSLKEQMGDMTSLQEQMGDMTSLLNTLQQQIKNLPQSPGKQVYFHAIKGSGSSIVSSGEILKLKQVVNNQGGGYSSDTGHFTAPFSGTYFFIATSEPDGPDKYADMLMIKEGVEVARTSVQQYSNYEVMGSCHAVLYLSAGQRVWLQSHRSSSEFSSETFFSGFQIY